MSDNRILQGTTPYLACHFNPEKLDVSTIIALELAMKQIKTYCPLLLIKGINDSTDSVVRVAVKFAGVSTSTNAVYLRIKRLS